MLNRVEQTLNYTEQTLNMCQMLFNIVRHNSMFGVVQRRQCSIDALIEVSIYTEQVLNGVERRRTY